MSSTLNPNHGITPECAICFEVCKVPVRFRCFPCKSSPGRPACHSLTRVCLLCARLYLELNKPRRQRSYSKRCLTCTATVRPSMLNAQQAYEKDFFIIQHDPFDKYTCAYDNDGCTSFQGTQEQLEQHLRDDCPFRTISCSHCKLYFVANQQTQHDQLCIGRRECEQCQLRIPITEMEQHRQQVHAIARCSQCLLNVPSTELVFHEEQHCAYRAVSCPVCLGYFRFYQLHDHLQQEEQRLTQNIHETITTLTQLSQQLLAVRQQLYPSPSPS